MTGVASDEVHNVPFDNPIFFVYSNNSKNAFRRRGGPSVNHQVNASVALDEKGGKIIDETFVYSSQVVAQGRCGAQSSALVGILKSTLKIRTVDRIKTIEWFFRRGNMKHDRGHEFVLLKKCVSD